MIARAFDREAAERILRTIWSVQSAAQWTADNPAAGQCNVTALVLQDSFGSDLLRTDVTGGAHFYNRINGVEVDLTAGQFDMPPAYRHLPASRDEVFEGITQSEYRYLREAFDKAWSDRDITSGETA